MGSQVLGVAIWERTPRGEEGEVWGWDGVGKREFFFPSLVFGCRGGEWARLMFGGCFWGM